MQKTKARWAALGSLFQSTGTELKDGLIANKVRQHSKRAAVGLAPSLPTLDEDGGDAGRAGRAASHAGGAAAEPPTENSNGDVAFPVTGAADEAPPEITDLANAAVFAMVDHVDLRDPSRQKPTRQSSIVTLLDVEERENFHVIEGDNPLARVAKLAYLEDEFQAVLRDTKELKTARFVLTIPSPTICKAVGSDVAFACTPSKTSSTKQRSKSLGTKLLLQKEEKV